MQEVILVRHGQTVFNEQGRYQGHMDTELSRVGLDQAAAVARRLQHEEIRAIYSSDLRRARQTAEVIAAACGFDGVICRRDLRERKFGAWEGLSFDEIQARFPELARRWLEDPLKLRPPCGETFAELKSRAARALRAVLALEGVNGCEQAERKGAIVVVSHGGFINALLVDILQMRPGAGVRLRVDNASISRIAFYDGFPVVICLNDISHLAGDNGTSPCSENIS